MLTKEEVLFERNEKGDLIHKTVKLEGKDNKEIVITPLMRSEVLRMREGLDIDGETTKDQDINIVLKHCINPKFTKEEIECSKKGYIDAIILTILNHSGIILNRQTPKDAIDKQSKEDKKKLKK